MKSPTPKNPDSVYSNEVLNAYPDPVAILDTETRILTTNKAYKEQARHSDSGSLFPPEGTVYLQSLQGPVSEGSDLALKLLLGIKSVVTGEEKIFTGQFQHYKGETGSWFRCHVNYMCESDLMMLTIRDISNSMKRQQLNRDYRQQHKQFFTNSVNGMLITDEQNLILDANLKAAEFTCLNQTELIGRKLTPFLSINLNQEALQKHIRRNGNYLGEFELTRDDEETLPVDIWVKVYRNNEGINVTQWVFAELSRFKNIQRKLSAYEDRLEGSIQEQNGSLNYKNILNHLPVAAYMTDRDGYITYYNEAAESLWGRKPETGKEKWCGSSELLDENNRPLSPGQNPVAKAIRENRTIKGLQAGLKRADGEIIPFLAYITPFTGADGEVDGAMNVVINQSAPLETTEELKRVKHFNELAIESTNLGLWELDLETGEAYYNEYWYHMLGFEKDEVKFTREYFYSLIHPDDRHIPETELSHYINGEKDNYQVEFRLKGKDGKYRWILALARFTEWNMQNKPCKIAGCHLDITDRKHAEQESHINHRLFKQLFNNSPIGIVKLDKDGMIKEINKSFEHIFGYRQDELEGKLLDTVIVPGHLEQQAENLTRASFKGDSFQVEAIRLAKGGEKVPVLIGGVPVDVEGEIDSIYGMYVDISERKKLENKILNLLESEKEARHHLEDMFEEAPSAIALTEGENHEFRFANNQYKELVHNSDLMGKALADALPDIALQGALEVMDRVFETGIQESESENKIVLLINDIPVTRYVNYICKPLFDENDEVYGILYEAIDVTEQVVSKKVIQDSLAEKEVLLGEVHHRVKNNLAIVSGLLELEALSVDDTTAQRYLRKSQSRITSIAQIHELLYRNESLSEVPFHKYIDKLLPEHLQTTVQDNGSVITIRINHVDEVFLNVNQAIPAGMLINEIISQVTGKDEGTNPQNCQLGISLRRNSGSDLIMLELEDECATLPGLLKELHGDNAGNLSAELISVLTGQLHGRIRFDEENLNKLYIEFSPNNHKGPHSAL